MKPTTLILFGILFSIGVLKAQTDFKPGYIINIAGDTIYGDIDNRGDLLMSGLCKFRAQDNIIKDYSPNDITAFRFIDGKYYVSTEVDDKWVFLEYLIKGKVNIFYMRDKSGDHFYLEKEGDSLTEMTYIEEIRKVDDKRVLYKSKQHIGLLNYYMQDAPEFQSRIQSLKKPDHQNLIKLAEDYHNAVCDGEQCIIYEKNTPFIKIFPELVSGVINYSNIEDLDDKFYMHTGIIAHVWMPRTSEKMYFRTGVLFSQLDLNGEKSNYYKIPFQFEYIYPKGLLRPRVAYGLNIYMPSGYQSVSFDVGANLKLSKMLSLSATSDIEFNPAMLILPKSMLSYSLKLGLFISIN